MTTPHIVLTAFVAALLVCATTPIASDTAVLASSETTERTTDGGIHQDQPSDDGDDDRVEVMVWTVFAAALALSIGLVLFLVRLVMGWVKVPPTPQEEHH
jgi:hypothetical protein